MAETEVEFEVQRYPRRNKRDEAVRLTEANQLAVAKWAGGRLGIHGVGVFLADPDGDLTAALGEWLVREQGTGRIQRLTDARFAELYVYEPEEVSTDAGD